MDLREFRVVVRIVDRVAKRALFADEQMVASCIEVVKGGEQ
jgi:hypothetical protein